jgi:hypothetical protein
LLGKLVGTRRRAQSMLFVRKSSYIGFNQYEMIAVLCIRREGNRSAVWSAPCLLHSPFRCELQRLVSVDFTFSIDKCGTYHTEHRKKEIKAETAPQDFRKSDRTKVWPAETHVTSTQHSLPSSRSRNIRHPATKTTQ